MPTLKKAMKFFACSTEGACSSIMIKRFDMTSYPCGLTKYIPSSTTGLYLAMFRQNEKCRRMYEALKEIFDIQYQSEPKMGNHGSKVIFCVFKERM